eukprot:gene25365-31815_t
MNEERRLKLKAFKQKSANVSSGELSELAHPDTYEPLELERFPFDRQILTLNAISANCTLMQFSCMEHLITGHHKCPDNFIPPAMIKSPDVSLTWEYDTWKLVKQHCLLESFKDRTSSMTFSIRVQRCAMFYVFNVGMVLFIIVASGFTIFATDPAEFNNRSYLFTILLTVVTFKFVTNSYIPMISYLTLMDYYILMAFCFVFCLLSESFLMTFMCKDAQNMDLFEFVDSVFLISYLVLWVLFNLFICLATFSDFFGNLFIRMSWADVIANNNHTADLTNFFESTQEEVPETRRRTHRISTVAMHYLKTTVVGLKSNIVDQSDLS